MTVEQKLLDKIISQIIREIIALEYLNARIAKRTNQSIIGPFDENKKMITV